MTMLRLLAAASNLAIHSGRAGGSTCMWESGERAPLGGSCSRSLSFPSVVESTAEELIAVFVGVVDEVVAVVEVLVDVFEVISFPEHFLHGGEFDEMASV